MKYFILTFFLVNYLLVFSQEGWTKHDLGKKVSVEFPNEPTTRNFRGQDVMVFMDTTGTYQVLCIQTQFDSDIQQNDTEIKKFYSEFIRGLLDGSKGEMVDSEYIKIGENTGVDCTYSFSKNGMSLLTTSRVIALNNTIYSISYTYLESEWEKNEKYRMKFLNSVNL